MDKKIAWFRFVNGLNDFLKPGLKNQMLKYCFRDAPAIKDAIEALGVPHTEVGAILVNQETVGFFYALKEADRVVVYPSSESAIEPVRFILDVHLGTLARYLRLLGFDVWYENGYDDNRIIALAEQHQRTILTRDVALLKNKKVGQGYWLRHTDPYQQVRELIQRFYLLDKVKPLTRCLVCNGLINPVLKEQIIDLLPPKTKIFYHEFFQCQKCQKVYWRGAHFQKILDLIDSFRQ